MNYYILIRNLTLNIFINNWFNVCVLNFNLDYLLILIKHVLNILSWKIICDICGWIWFKNWNKLNHHALIFLQVRCFGYIAVRFHCALSPSVYRLPCSHVHRKVHLDFTCRRQFAENATHADDILSNRNVVSRDSTQKSYFRFFEKRFMVERATGRITRTGMEIHGSAGNRFAPSIKSESK